MKTLLLLAALSILDLPGCGVCGSIDFPKGKIVNFKDVTWPAGVSIPPEWQTTASATCTSAGWTLPPSLGFDVSKLPLPAVPPAPCCSPVPFIFPTNEPGTVAAP